MAGGFQSDVPPAVNQTAKKYIRGMMKGRHRWNKLYGSRSKEVMHKTANKMAMGEMQKMPPTYNEIFGEANKSGDSSLRDWFSKSRSSDGTPGWVQLGGKYAGKPCAKQPGQTTKPKCGSSKMKRALNSDEEEKAFRRKNAEDPNPDRRGKAKNVATEETIREARNPYAIGMAKAQELTGDTPPLKKSTIKKAHKIAKAIKKEEVELEEGRATDVAINMIRKTQGDNPKYLSKRSEMIRRLKQRQLDKYLKDRDKKKKERVTNVGMGESLEWLTEEQFDEAAGEKDACYKKVKARYKVWPSAYASGALVKCRKVGAANWGNKSESFQEFQEKALKCWKGCRRVPGTTPGAKGSCTCEGMEETNEGAAWTKKAGQNSEGGLNEKGRKSYERENPGSDLKRPSKKVGNKRRASFCARMQGMKKRLTSAKLLMTPIAESISPLERGTADEIL